MLDGINFLCFTGCFVVAAFLEISRFFYRSKLRDILLVSVVALGLFAQTLYLYSRAAHFVANSLPLSNTQDWLLLATWIVVAVYLSYQLTRPSRNVGIFLLPLVLALIGASHFADATPFNQRAASMTWGMIHGTSLLVATVTIFLGGVCSIMYLVQSSRLKRKLPPRRGIRLPSLEWLEAVTTRSVLVSTAFLAVGLAGGVILNRAGVASGSASLSMTDPLVLATKLLFVIMLLTSCVVFYQLRGTRGQRIAQITLVVLAVWITLFVVMLFADSLHGKDRTEVTWQWVKEVVE